MLWFTWRPKWYRDFVLRRLPPGGQGAEVGVWKGQFSQRILKVARPSTLHLIDPWRLVPNHPSRCWGSNSSATQADLDQVYEGVRATFAEGIRSGRVVLHRLPSIDAVAEIPDASLDFVYLDGDHRYEAVLRDLNAWWPKLKPSGTLIGDDFDLPKSLWGDGVTQAAREFAAQRGVPLEDCGRHQFRIARRPATPADLGTARAPSPPVSPGNS